MQIEKEVLQGRINRFGRDGARSLGAVQFALADFCLLAQFIEQAAASRGHRCLRFWLRRRGIRFADPRCRLAGDLRKHQAAVDHAGTGLGNLFPLCQTFRGVEVKGLDVGEQ